MCPCASNHQRLFTSVDLLELLIKLWKEKYVVWMKSISIASIFQILVRNLSSCLLNSWPLNGSKISKFQSSYFNSSYTWKMSSLTIYLFFIRVIHIYFAYKRLSPCPLKPSKIVVFKSWPLNGFKWELINQFDHWKLNCKVKLDQ